MSSPAVFVLVAVCAVGLGFFVATGGVPTAVSAVALGVVAAEGARAFGRAMAERRSDR